MMSNDVIQKRRQPVLLNTIRDSQDEVSPVSSMSSSRCYRLRTFFVLCSWELPMWEPCGSCLHSLYESIWVYMLRRSETHCLLHNLLSALLKCTILFWIILDYNILLILSSRSRGAERWRCCRHPAWRRRQQCFSEGGKSSLWWQWRQWCHEKWNLQCHLSNHMFTSALHDGMHLNFSRPTWQWWLGRLIDSGSSLNSTRVRHVTGNLCSCAILRMPGGTQRTQLHRDHPKTSQKLDGRWRQIWRRLTGVLK